MASETQILANRPNAQESDSPRTEPMEKSTMNTGAPGDYFMQNKPNFRNSQINVRLNTTKDYGNFRLYGRRKSKPKQTQFQTRRRFFCLLHKRLPRPFGLESYYEIYYSHTPSPWVRLQKSMQLVLK